jgi:hypothetical protein
MTPRDRIVRAPGVAVEGNEIVDAVRGLRLRANETARELLARADGRSTIAELDAADVLDFCAQLNRHLLVNVRARRLGTLTLPVRTTVVRAVLPPALALTLLALPLALAAHAWAVAPALGAGVLMHELAHAAALHGLPRAGVRRGLRAAVLHPRLTQARALAVGAAGPLAPSLAALVLVHRAPLAAVPLAAHALALTVASPDGRSACGLP